MPQTDRAALPEPTSEELTRLRRCLNDLVSVTGLAAVWSGREPAQVADMLLDALFGMLGLAFALVVLDDGANEAPLEVMRVGAPLLHIRRPQDLREVLGVPPGASSRQHWLPGSSLRLDGTEFCFASARLGIEGAIGIVVVGSHRPHFPDQTEALLIQVAANQAAIAIQQTRLMQGRLVEATLRETAREARLIIDTIPALAWTARPDGTAESFNKSYLDFVGLSAEAAMDWGWTAAVHPADADGWAAVWRRIIGCGQPGTAEARLRRFDGEYRWFLMRANPLRDESGAIVRWYGVNTDIQDWKQTQEELRHSEGFLAEAQKISSTGSFAWRLDTDALVFSDELYRIFEFDSGSAVTSSQIRTRVHPDDLQLLSNMTDQIRAGGYIEVALRLQMPTGGIKYVRIFGHVVQHEGAHRECLGAVQDVTQRHVSDEALERARAELAHVARSISLGALTASIAHEVNQPLSGIVTNAGTCIRMLAADPPHIDGAIETARRTIRDGNRAAEVIARLRTLFSNRPGPIEAVDLNDAAREVIALVSGDLQRNRVVLRTELDDDAVFVTGDRVQLQQVILNLVRNASDAMREVEERPRHLLVKTEREGSDRIRLTVRDSGSGVDPLAADRLFDAFYTTKRDGMGIGLSVSRSIIEKHQGRLWTAPNNGPGATFAFSIPCTAP